MGYMWHKHMWLYIGWCATYLDQEVQGATNSRDVTLSHL